MDLKTFCKIYSGYYGEEINHIDQIRYTSFTGEELKELIEHFITQIKLIKSSKSDKYQFIDSLIKEFKNSYENSHLSSYELIAIGKERKAMGVILQEFKKKKPEADSVQTIKELRAYFNLCNSIEDTWLNQNMSLSIIVSKFNEINNILRNGIKRKAIQQGTTDEELAGVFAKHFATDYTK